jgi:hypothetical protein
MAGGERGREPYSFGTKFLELSERAALLRSPPAASPPGIGRVAEIGVADLSLSSEQAAALLQAAGVTLAPDELAVLHQRTEGWPVGLYLAALSLREGGSFENAVRSFGGDDRLVKEYIESEVLARISPRHRMFLTRTAVLERMCGALCDAVLACTLCWSVRTRWALSSSASEGRKPEFLVTARSTEPASACTMPRSAGWVTSRSASETMIRACSSMAAQCSGSCPATAAQFPSSRSSACATVGSLAP